MNRQRPGVGQESVWDYPRPPRVEPVATIIEVELGGRLLARTSGAHRVLETSHPPVYYLPRVDVDLSLLQPSGRRSFCEWKGTARYFSVQLGDQRVDDVAWCYDEPSVGFEAIRGAFAFYAQKMDRCTVAGERVRPQPGGFYGGWITDSVVGPFKGEPGTGGW